MEKYRNSLILLLFAYCLLPVACNDEWDDHYKESETNNLEMTDYLKSNENLSTFTKILELTGYDDTLKLSRSYTVFAPTNQALENINMNDMDMLKKIVGNHIANYPYTTSELLTDTTVIKLLMYNKKYIRFEGKTGYTFGDKTISTPNIITKNGIVHILENYCPYQYNIWEFIQVYPGIDSIRNYANSLSELAFDRAASYDKDNIFIDSVFTEQNWILDNLGAIDREQNMYTAILPTNEAWNEAYQQLFPHYKSLNKTVEEKEVDGAALQVSRTKWAVSKNFLYRGMITDPADRDSITSCLRESGYYKVVKNPGYLFEGATSVEMSNGISYITNKLLNKPEDFWFPEIRVEAESNTYSLREYSNCTLESYSSIGTNVKTSKNLYVRMESLATGALSRISATFPIPNTLAGIKYNIYCVFVPTSAIDPTDLRPFLANFYLSYIGADGKIKKDQKLIPVSNTTTPDQVTKLLVAENFEFSYCDLVESSTLEAMKKEIHVFLKIENAASTTDERQGKYSRHIGLDCIILEPVIE